MVTKPRWLEVSCELNSSLQLNSEYWVHASAQLVVPGLLFIFSSGVFELSGEGYTVRPKLIGILSICFEHFHNHITYKT